MNGVTYYVRFFPYATDGTTNVNATNYGTGIPKGSYVYGFHINSGDSNPSTAVTYLEDAVGKTPVSMNYSVMSDMGSGNIGSGNSSEYYCDYGYVGADNYYAWIEGHWSSWHETGAFAYCLWYGSTTGNITVNASLSAR